MSKGVEGVEKGSAYVDFLLRCSFLGLASNNNNNRHTHRSFAVIRIQCECLRAYVFLNLEVFSAGLGLHHHTCLRVYSSTRSTHPSGSIAESAKAKEEQECFELAIARSKIISQGNRQMVHVNGRASPP